MDSSAELATGGDLFSVAAAIIAAQIQVVGAMFTDPEMKLARRANARVFADSHRGLLLGPRHPKFEEEKHRAGLSTRSSSLLEDI